MELSKLLWSNRWKAGSLYQNYKDFKSLMLMAIDGPNYEIFMFDLGEYGRQSDSGILASPDLRKAFKKGTLKLPTPFSLPLSEEGSVLLHPIVLVGDEAFELTHYMMEGWMLFLTTINAKPENVEHYTRAVLVLHNLLIAECKNYGGNGASDYFDRNGDLVDGDWRDDAEFANAANFSNISASCIRNSPQIARPA
uniref:DDE Tnp4 domain-containing protein n=1 Tax=Daphnia galeata TaxID=27404 RepID=A0A8J2RIP9_9CRUS|nr:unnamed protein product [Daphnia galeata]